MCMARRVKYTVLVATLSVILTVVLWNLRWTDDASSGVEHHLSSQFLAHAFSSSQSLCPSDLFLTPTSLDFEIRNLSVKRSTLFDLDPRLEYTEEVVIMTPVSNAENVLPRYFSNLCSLTYPHHLISVALAEDSSRDATYQVALNYLKKIQKYFASVNLFTLKETLPFQPVVARHDMGWQYTRRSHLAKSRNTLVSRGLHNETWVLWMDSDVRYIPPDLIQQLLAARKDILVPSCMFRANGKKVDDYDRNNWKDTDQAREFLKDKGNNFLMLEGYGPAMRLYLSKLKAKGNVVEIDGVGGCVLLINADLHRKGLVFPPYVYKNHIETEALAKMAQDMGYKIYGLPNLEVYHG